MYPFRRLKVWAKSHELALLIYASTASIAEKRFPGLTSQLRRAACSIPTNVAEGAGRDSAPQFSHFLQIALASARELDYLLLLTADLGAIPRSDHARFEARNNDVSRMLNGLRDTVRRNGTTYKSKAHRSRNTPKHGKAPADPSPPSP